MTKNNFYKHSNNSFTMQASNLGIYEASLTLAEIFLNKPHDVLSSISVSPSISSMCIIACLNAKESFIKSAIIYFNSSSFVQYKTLMYVIMRGKKARKTPSYMVEVYLKRHKLKLRTNRRNVSRQENMEKIC